MTRKIKIIIIIAVILVGASLFLYTNFSGNSSTNSGHWENDVGTVNKTVYGNANAKTEMVLIAGIHPREPLSIEPEIKAAEEFAKNNDVKFTVYHVNVTKDATDYDKSRENGEGLVHDFVMPDVINNTHADSIIISHSHIEGYGQGFYLATPAMDNTSVAIAQKIANESSFNYFPRDTSQPVQATSAKLVSIPLAESGNPTFVYEIPENITDQDSTDKALELFGLMFNIVKK